MPHTSKEIPILREDNYRNDQYRGATFALYTIELRERTPVARVERLSNMVIILISFIILKYLLILFIVYNFFPSKIYRK